MDREGGQMTRQKTNLKCTICKKDVYIVLTKNDKELVTDIKDKMFCGCKGRESAMWIEAK